MTFTDKSTAQYILNTDKHSALLNTLPLSYPCPPLPPPSLVLFIHLSSFLSPIPSYFAPTLSVTILSSFTTHPSLSHLFCSSSRSILYHFSMRASLSLPHTHRFTFSPQVIISAASSRLMDSWIQSGKVFIVIYCFAWSRLFLYNQIKRINSVFFIADILFLFRAGCISISFAVHASLLKL